MTHHVVPEVRPGKLDDTDAEKPYRISPVGLTFLKLSKRALQFASIATSFKRFI